MWPPVPAQPHPCGRGAWRGQRQEMKSSSAVMLIGCDVGSLHGPAECGRLEQALEREQWELTAPFAGQSRAGDTVHGQTGAGLAVSLHLGVVGLVSMWDRPGGLVLVNCGFEVLG